MSSARNDGSPTTAQSVGRARVLILSGSAEGYRLADLLAGEGIAALSSFAGVTSARRHPAGAMRVGGFGGVEGLTAFLAEAGIRAVVDATHPFAAAMSRNAAEACHAVGLPCLHILRPPWTPSHGDRWRSVPSMAAAAEILPPGARAFLTIGRTEIGAFAGRDDVAFLARTIDAPDLPLPRHLDVVRAKGPFTLADEREILEVSGITWLVTKNSGGAASAAKLQAAREAGIEVLMVERPAPPPGMLVETVDEALAWVRRTLVR